MSATIQANDGINSSVLSLATNETATGNTHQNPANSNSLPNKLPQTPAPAESGNLIDRSAGHFAPQVCSASSAQQKTSNTLASDLQIDSAAQPPPADDRIHYHQVQDAGNESATDPLDELLHRALRAAPVRRGRPLALDEQARGQLIALLSVGMSMRQAAAVLRVSHTTVQKTLKADPTLAEEITAARFQAQLQPLACVIREARRSWKAATWLLKYLDGKIATHEETPDECRERQARERAELVARIKGGR